ncbi:DUF2333 family protein [Lentilitoribacter sp. Alg239-R112]|uniref:DUF2333 family protein n=1 Tax=Lentilitoribacter sp. Alg239-R112 TaxID=2305987 RepID=UPI0013A6B419|nr:DUF2333 family protein [Lentilitoribacter sp. Alg239-R112]
MLDPVIEFFGKIFSAIKRGFLAVIAFILAPFVALIAWYKASGWILRIVIGFVVFFIFGGYGYFTYNTQVWHGFDPQYTDKYEFSEAAIPGTVVGNDLCAPSGIVTVTGDLIDFNVNQNAWVSSSLLYKAGFFGIDWDHTPFFDNKASFQRGVNQAIRRTTAELVDTLGRVRGTSQVDNDLQEARGVMQTDEERWYFSTNPFGFTTPSQSYYRTGQGHLNGYNQRLVKCDAVFDARADNLIRFLDRIASDIGSTSAILRTRSESSNAGWFDTRADDRFWFAFGQLYAYHGILQAAHADFVEVISQRNLDRPWDEMEEQLVAALRIQPAVISNGNESGWIMPTHLATMGFYILRFRSNLIEIRSILDR